MSSPEIHLGIRSVLISVRFDDLGPAGHVNNVASVRIIEEGRRTFLGRPATHGAAGGLLDYVPADVRHFVRRQDVEYLGELWYQADPFVVTMQVTAVGTTSFRLRSEIRSSAAADPAVTAETVLVLADQATSTPWPIPSEIADLLLAGVPPQPSA